MKSTRLFLAGFFLSGRLVAATLGGSVQHDTLGLLQEGAGRFASILEGRMVFQHRQPLWQVYGDARLYWKTGFAAVDGELSFALVRGYVRLTPGPLELTFGKTLLNMGAPGIFNPFSLDKSLSLTDLTRTREGREAVTAELRTGSFSGFKLLAAPGDPAWTAGLEFFARPGGLDLTLGAVRLATNHNLVGGSLRADPGVGISLAAVVHCDDRGRQPALEATLTLDWSIGKWSLLLGGYANGRGAARKEDYSTLPAASTYTLGRLTLFLQNRLHVDEFLSFTLDSFGNPEDGSLVILPGVYWTISEGLTCTIIISVPLGNDGGEYAPSRAGDLGFLARVLAKF
jgi:hypothetical protein